MIVDFYTEVECASRIGKCLSTKLLSCLETVLVSSGVVIVVVPVWVSVGISLLAVVVFVEFN